jgi:hypothetical protein
MFETIFVGFLVYATIGVFVNIMLLIDNCDFIADCGVLTCLLLWPLISIG